MISIEMVDKVSVKERLRRLAKRRHVQAVSGRKALKADHVGFLDGDTLWVSISDGVPAGSRLALRDVASGELMMLDDAPVPDAGGLAGTVDLSPLAPRISSRGGAELVVVHQRHAVPVRPARPVPSTARPSIVPSTSDGRHAFRTRPARSFVITATVPTPGVAVRAVRLDDDRIEVLVDTPQDATVTACLCDSENEARVVAQLPATVTPEGCLITVHDEDVELPAGEFALVRVVVDGTQLPARRGDYDLRDPARAVALPWLAGTGANTDTVVVAEYRREGQFALRRRPVEED